MTNNYADKPNNFHLNGDVSVGASFGVLYSVTPICLPGEGHHPHVKVRFSYGLSICLDAYTATELARRLPESLKQLPLIPDCHDAILDQDGEEYA